jgi:hypothetical protein
MAGQRRHADKTKQTGHPFLHLFCCGGDAKFPRLYTTVEMVSVPVSEVSISTLKSSKAFPSITVLAEVEYSVACGFKSG